MGTWNDSQDCPKCGAVEALMTCGTNRPYDQNSGECIECGFYFCTKEGQFSLDELNERRAEWGHEPLNALPKQRG